MEVEQTTFVTHLKITLHYITDYLKKRLLKFGQMSHFTCQSRSFISIFFTRQVSACELQPFFCHDLANDIYPQTAKTVFSHLNKISQTEFQGNVWS